GPAGRPRRQPDLGVLLRHGGSVRHHHRARCPRPAPAPSAFADGVVGYPYCIPVSWESDDWALPRVPPWPTSIVTRLRLCRPTATSTTEPGRMPEAQMEQLVSYGRRPGTVTRSRYL